MTRRKLKHGFSPKDYARNIRWKVDYDYLDKLDPQTKAWLQDFTEHQVAASFPDKDQTEGWDTAQRRAAYRAKNAANKDLYAISDAAGLVEFPTRPLDYDTPDHGQDWNQTPNYLSSPAYRQLLTELREAQDAKPRDPVRVNNLRRQLERFTKLAP